MNYLKSLIKSLLVVFIPLLIFAFLTTLLYYFDIIPFAIYTVLLLIIPIFNSFTAAFLFGKKASKLGWLEGIKIGGLTSFIFLIISSILGNNFTIKTMLFFFILLFTSSVGGMVGINKKKS